MAVGGRHTLDAMEIRLAPAYEGFNLGNSLTQRRRIHMYQDSQINAGSPHNIHIVSFGFAALHVHHVVDSKIESV